MLVWILVLVGEETSGKFYAFKTCITNNAIFYCATENYQKILWEESRLLFKCHNFKKRHIVELVFIDKIDNFNLSKGYCKVNPVMHAMIVTCLTYHEMPLLCR